MKRSSLLLLAMFAMACTRAATTTEPKIKEPHGEHQQQAASPVPAVMSVAPTRGDWGLARFQDLNPAPNKIEVKLEAKPTEIEYLPGKKAQVWAYNGSVPGPLLEANIGDEVTIQFTNSLPEPTTIHWHGLRLPNDMDGSPTVQKPVQPGASFTYRFTLMDEGLYWFHPHLRSDKQVEKGLYGIIMVRGKQEPNLQAKESILVLDDVLLDESGDLARFIPEGPMKMTEGAHQHTMSAPSDVGYVCPMHPDVKSDKPGACHICKMDLVPATGEHSMSADDMEAMIGRHGNVLLVNGKPRPTLTLRAGERQRWRIVNTANSRYFRLSLPNHSFTLIGVDGGLLEAPQTMQELLLAPGERADVIVEAAGAPGDTFDLMTLAYARGHGLGKEAPAEVLHVEYTKEPALAALPAIPGSLRDIEALSVSSVEGKKLSLYESMAGGVSFSIVNEADPNGSTLRSKLGEVEVWEVSNNTEMDHPFHLHGFFFQVLDRNGVAEPYVAWKDTVNIPGKQKLRFAVRFDGFPGRWMYHCHILEHGERGMMGELLVER